MSTENPTKEENLQEELKGLDDDVEETLVLVSSETEDPKKFELNRKAAFMSNFVKSVVEADQSAHEIPIKKVNGEILELIVEYLKHHNGKTPTEIAKPIRSVKMDKIVEDKWDADYINKMSKKLIFQVILGANYMDIKALLHLGCAKIATLIKGKSPDEIKQILSDDSNEIQVNNNDEPKEETV